MAPKVLSQEEIILDIIFFVNKKICEEIIFLADFSTY